MNVLEAANDDVCRLCCVLSSKRRHSRYPTVSVRLLLMLMVFSCRIRITTADLDDSKTVVMAADDAIVWTSSASVDDSASLSAVADRPPENFDHGRLASLPRRDDSSARDRHRSTDWWTLIVGGPASQQDGPGRRPAARHDVVNNSTPPATTTTVVAGVNSPSATSVNAAPVITAPRGRSDHLLRIQIRSTSAPHSRSLFSTVFNALGTLFQQPDNSYLQSGTSFSLSVDRAAATVVKQLSNGIYSVKSNSTHWSLNDTVNKLTGVADDIGTFSQIYGKDAGLEHSRGGDVRRTRRQSGVESVDEVDRPASLSDGRGLLTGTSIDRTSAESSTVRSRTPEALLAADPPLGAAALRYRSRGNFAALVDPMNSGRASNSAGLASANKWRHLPTASDNSTSLSPVTDETTASLTTISCNISSDSDSIEIQVLKPVTNDSFDTATSVSAATEAFNDSSKTLNSTLAPSVEWNCSKPTSLRLQAALKIRMSYFTAAVCVYTVSFLFTLLAAWAVTGIILSLCIRNQRPLQVADRRSSSQMVLGFVTVAAAARALGYVAAEYHLLAAVALPGGHRAIYECWFPFIIAAFFVHQRLFYGKASTQENNLSTDRGHHMKRTGCRRDLCVVNLALCSYLTLVFSLCLLIEFCVIPVEAVFALRLVFAVFAVFLSAANIHKLATSSGRHIATQVVLRILFVICAAFSAVDATALLSDDFAMLFQQRANVLIAVEAADRLAEFCISVLLCANSSSTFSRFQCEKSQKSVSVGDKNVPGTKIYKTKVVNYCQASTLSAKSPTTRHSWLHRLVDRALKKSKVVDAGSTPPQISLGVVHAVGWASTSTEDPAKVNCVSPLPPPSRVTRSRSMLYNDHGFIRFRVDGDTDGESDARTLDDDDGGPGQARSVPASEYASAEDLGFRRGPSSSGTPRWSRPGSPSLGGFRAPSIHLQDSIDRALDRCDIWRVGREQGQLSVDELRRIVQLYADINDCRRGNQYHRRRAAGTTSINYAEV